MNEFFPLCAEKPEKMNLNNSVIIKNARNDYNYVLEVVLDNIFSEEMIDIVQKKDKIAFGHLLQRSIFRMNKSLRWKNGR